MNNGVCITVGLHIGPQFSMKDLAGLMFSHTDKEAITVLALISISHDCFSFLCWLSSNNNLANKMLNLDQSVDSDKATISHQTVNIASKNSIFVKIIKISRNS